MTLYRLMSITTQHGAMRCIFMAIIFGLCRMIRRFALPAGQRDTWLMQPQERISLVFRADNPGLWLFHCHMLEHAASGMGAVLSID